MVTFFAVTIGWILSVCVHEYCHAVVAYAGGDLSVKEKGYLSFNPLRYAHPVYSLLMPILFLMMGGIGLPGAAVYIDRNALRSKHWNAAVSLAGPVGSLLVALVLVVVFHLVPAGAGELRPALALLVLLQVTAVLFNLLPVPPLDGFGIIEPYLSPAALRQLAPVRQWGMWAIILCLWYVEPANVAFWNAIYGILRVLQIDPGLAIDGLRAFRFWLGMG